MNQGKIVKNIEWIDRISDKIDPITNFKASEYWVAIGSNHNNTLKYDYVIGESNGQEVNFYMNWVKSFNF